MCHATALHQKGWNATIPVQHSKLGFEKMLCSFLLGNQHGEATESSLFSRDRVTAYMQALPLLVNASAQMA